MVPNGGASAGRLQEALALERNALLSGAQQTSGSLRNQHSVSSPKSCIATQRSGASCRVQSPANGVETRLSVDRISPARKGSLNRIYTEVRRPPVYMDPDVEAVIEGIESAFDVKFRVSDIGDQPTFERVCAALRSILGNTDSHRCLASIVFWRLRPKMAELLNLSKDSIRLDTRVDSLVSPFRSRQLWRSISEQSGLRLPGLELPRWVALLLILVTVAPYVGAFIWIDNTGRSKWDLLLLLIATPFIGAALYRMATLFAVVQPVHSLVMRDLVRTVVGLNHGKLLQEFGPSTDRELRKSLEYVVRDITGTEYLWLEGEDFDLSDLVHDGLRGGSNLI